MADIKLYLKSISGKTTTVTVPANSRIGFVKNALQDKEGIPPQQQRFTFGATELTDDDMTLELAGIKVGLLLWFLLFIYLFVSLLLFCLFVFCSSNYSLPE